MRGTRRSRWFIMMCRAACLFLASLPSACSSSDDAPPRSTPTSPTLPTPPSPSNHFVTEGILPVAGKPAEHTAVRIWGDGFQSGAVVTFDGSATPATVESGHVILTTAPPHPAGAIDIVVINPDGRTSRLEKPFTYVENFLASGDISIGPGDSVTATLDPFERTCGDDGYPCRLLVIRAPADDMVEIELVSLDGRERIGLYEQAVFWGALSHFPKQMTVRGGQQVWVIGDVALFSLTVRLAK
jgi:IPT/TIG domain-containing protein